MTENVCAVVALAAVCYLVFALRFSEGPINEFAAWKRSDVATKVVFWLTTLSVATLFCLANFFVLNCEWEWFGVVATVCSFLPSTIMWESPRNYLYRKSATSFPIPPGFSKDVIPPEGGHYDCRAGIFRDERGRPSGGRRRTY